MFLILLKQLLLVLLFDGLLLALAALLLAPLAIYRKAAFAVLKRNFISYFTTPTGYVFLCLFVLLSSFAAFWPHDFFASNMATLDQLNFWIPLILLLFVPAITMSIWAEERRQGTDELLLTIPAGDVDIVLGKYLSAAAIFTASLLFSQLAIFSVLNVVAKGGVDLGLYFSTYIGYWFMGMAMLAVGMVASFLTSNLTVGFILGAAFNAPLALANYVDVIIADAGLAQSVGRWSMASRFQDFGRGVISLSAATYFTVVIACGIYLSVVLIGRRHWLGGKDGHSLLGHFLVRAVSVLIIAVSATVLFAGHDFIRRDATSAQISSLSPESYTLIDELGDVRPIRIEAYVSKSLPENFVRTKYDLINLLKELQTRGGDKIKVAINDHMEPFSDEAEQARDRYGITPVAVPNEAYGTVSREDVFLAAAVTSGPERVVIKFFGPGTPIEYELVRAIMTVATPLKKDDGEDAKDTKNKEDGAKEGGDSDKKGKKDEKKSDSRRKKIGIMRTDAQLTGGFNFQTFQQFRGQMIVDELRKQYDVDDVSPGPVDKDEVDALVVVQPSSLTPNQLPYVLDAIRAGIPTAIFEDPMPWWFDGSGGTADVPGTDEQKRPMGGMMGRQPPQQKCNIQDLWDLLGVYMVKAKKPEVSTDPADVRRNYEKNEHEIKVTWKPFTPIVWQKYNPYPKTPEIPDFAVFASADAAGAEEAFNADDPIVSGMQEVLFMTPGAFEEAKDKTEEAKHLKFIPLISTGTRSGLLSDPTRAVNSPGLREIKRQSDTESQEVWLDITKVRSPMLDPHLETGKHYVLAARITGKLNEPSEEESEKAKGDNAADENAEEKGDGDSTDKDGDAHDGKKDASKKNNGEDAEDGEDKVNVVLVGDIDMLASLFVQIRDQPISESNYKFQNVALVQNIIDDLAGEERFINIRKRTPRHASLKLIEELGRRAENLAEEKEDEAIKGIKNSIVKFQTEQEEIVRELSDKIKKAQKEGTLDEKSIQELVAKRAMQDKQNEERLQTAVERQQRQMEEKRRKIDRDLAIEKRDIQNYFKALAVIMPTIPPLIIAAAVFFARRMKESQGVSQERRR